MKKRKIEEQIFKHYRKAISRAYRRFEASNKPFTAIYMKYGTKVGEDTVVSYRVHKGQSLRPVKAEKAEKDLNNIVYDFGFKSHANKGKLARRIGNVSVIIDHERKVIKHEYVFGFTWGMGEEVPFRVEKNKVIIEQKKAKMLWIS